MIFSCFATTLALMVDAKNVSYYYILLLAGCEDVKLSTVAVCAVFKKERRGSASMECCPTIIHSYTLAIGRG
jgi:hypothetical protein